MAYSAAGLATASGCSCADPSLTDVESAAGLKSVNSPLSYPIVLDQGVKFDQTICLTKGNLSPMAISMTSGAPDGKLVFPADQEICVVVGDQVRVLGYDSCNPDADDIYTVAAISNVSTERSVTLTGFNTGKEAKTFKTATTTSETLLGCIGKATAKDSAGPRIIQHIPADAKFTITGGATARSDYSNSFGIEFAANNAWILSRITGLVKPGDTIVSSDAGITTPVKVLEVRQVGTAEGVDVEKIRLATPPTSTGCYLAHIRRGRLFSMDMSYDPQGCIRLKVASSGTAGLQLLDSWKVESDGNCDLFNVGCYTVAVHWSTLDGTQLENHSRIVFRGDVYIRSSHIFDNDM